MTIYELLDSLGIDYRVDNSRGNGDDGCAIVDGPEGSEFVLSRDMEAVEDEREFLANRCALTAVLASSDVYMTAYTENEYGFMQVIGTDSCSPESVRGMLQDWAGFLTIGE